MGAYTHNHIANGNLELWDAGPVPAEMDAQVTNTVITTLDRTTMDQQSPQANAWAAIAGREDRLVYEGDRSLRATLAAAAAADAFRLMPEGVAAVAFTGASAFDVRANLGFNDHKYAFTFAARCNTDNNLLTVRIILRSAADAVVMYLTNAGAWQPVATGAADIDFGMRTRWQRFGIGIPEVPYQSAGVVIENMIWQVSNGTAGAQVIDLDDLVITDLANSYAAP
jgi:hypothetical protein